MCKNVQDCARMCEKEEKVVENKKKSWIHNTNCHIKKQRQRMDEKLERKISKKKIFWGPFRLTPDGLTLVYFENDLRTNRGGNLFDYVLVPGNDECHKN